MKKRVAKSEIEIARKSSRILFLISFILLILLFLGFGVLYVMDVDLTSYIHIDLPETKKVEEKKQTIKKGIILDTSPIAVQVDINDGNIIRFFETVKVTNLDVCLDGHYQDQKQIISGDLSTKCKFSLASKK